MIFVSWFFSCSIKSKHVLNIISGGKTKDYHQLLCNMIILVMFEVKDISWAGGSEHQYCLSSNTWGTHGVNGIINPITIRMSVNIVTCNHTKTMNGSYIYTHIYYMTSFTKSYFRRECTCKCIVTRPNPMFIADFLYLCIGLLDNPINGDCALYFSRALSPNISSLRCLHLPTVFCIACLYMSCYQWLLQCTEPLKTMTLINNNDDSIKIEGSAQTSVMAIIHSGLKNYAGSHFERILMNPVGP